MNLELVDQSLLTFLQRRGDASARELGEALGKSQPGISRVIAQAGDRVVRIGRARRSRYAAVRDVRGLGTHWPLYRIDAQGRAQAFGRLTALAGDGCFVAANTSVAWLRGEFVDGLFPGLPWFLDDMRPQGFLGRQFVHRFAPELGLADDLLRWGVDALLAALLLRGADAPGNFVLGEAALQRALDATREAIRASARSQRYAALALAVMAGDPVGSSAAGEQPKFTARVDEDDGSVRHVIVKFSEPMEGNSSARRWADLLVAEHEAARVLAQHGHDAAATEIVHTRSRVCLESTRFDRIGEHGRRGVMTLAAWSDAHDGVRDDWAAAAARMHRDGWVSAATLAQVRQRWWFGRLIGNSDMHFGNLAFFLDEQLPLELAPAYDMLPMCYRPGSSGAMSQQPLVPPSPLPTQQGVWVDAARLARVYWNRLADLDTLGAGFRQLAQANAAAIAAAQQRFT